jgi:hypothetical protein
VNLTAIFGFVFVVLSVGLVIILAAAGRSRTGRSLREIPAFARLRRSVGLAVESGTRLHISLGRGDLTGMEGASALVGLAMQERIARAASISDRPPVATAGNGAIGVLSRDTFSASYRAIGASEQLDPTLARVVGLTPMSYAAGAVPVIHDENITANILWGHMGSEAALINEAAERTGSLTIAGTDHIPGQAVLYAAAQEPLIGEEVFAGGAYLGAGRIHEASLRMQDLLRLLIIFLILGSLVLRLVGLDQVVLNLLSGFEQ